MFEKTYLDFKTFLKHNLQYKRWNVKLRTISSIMTVEKGRFLYEFDGGGFELKEGESVFLPIGSSYSYKVTSSECKCYQIMFNICDENGSINQFKLTADVYSVLSLFFERVRDSREKLQIYNALKLIEEHYNEPISVSQLANASAMSQSQLRRLFQKETGMTMSAWRKENKI